jgi:excisionase family DNA binding protein
MMRRGDDPDQLSVEAVMAEQGSGTGGGARYGEQRGVVRAALAGENDATTVSCASPMPNRNDGPASPGAAGVVGLSADPSGDDAAPLLYTPAQAAELLQVPESWLRRRAARRAVPCTFLGKHLRFSRANLDQITTTATRPATPRPVRGRRNPR